ncbi:hypothetical protein GOHSU_06_00530 [Gordonia hirsuta DSM 44140 = NBRC 16056]|uniref:Uncharacterized protein n=1 Tax=Gordonia hirsuta DSM 44140 = NBRC 16056 TaxID=1121927 RepID=L7L6S1_9ACTN|nr:hypothetical protein GOHSU_06_00530 [Gordonia hirsuta DSM 44140 = NBRC 16056]
MTDNASAIHAHPPRAEGADVRAPASGVPDLPTLLGLRSPIVAFSITLLAIGYTVVIASTAGAEVIESFWTAQLSALALALAAIATSLLIPADPLPVWSGVILVLAALAALALAWWHLPGDGGQWWMQMTAPPAMTAIVAGFMALRGRSGLAWLTLAGSLGVAAVWTVDHGAPLSQMMPMTNRVLTTVLPATIIALMVRPLMTLMGALREREMEAVAVEAASAATLAERDGRLSMLENDARPLLEQFAAGEPLSEDQALTARLIENTLRDEVRGRGWTSEGVRWAVRNARSRGAQVHLLDDGGLDLDRLTAREADTLHGELIRTVTELESGTVIARILPPGRDAVAMLTVIDGEVQHRWICQVAPVGLHWAPAD